MARTCSSTRARSTAAGSAWAPSADTARPPRTVSRSSSRRSEGSSSTATSNNSEPIRGSPSTDPKGASSKPGSPGTHPTGAQVSTSSRSVNTPIAPGSHTHPTQSSPTPRTTPRCVVVMPSQPELPGLPTHPLHRDRFEAPGGHQRPRKVTLTRALSTALRSARIVEPQRRADPRRVQPCWSPRKCAGGHFSARRRPAQGAPGSRQALISRCRAAGPLPARSEPRSGQGPPAMKGPRGGTLLGTTDPHE